MNLFGNRNAGASNITTAELARRMENGDKPAILDVRTAQEFTGDGHIPGAMHIPLDRLPSELARLDKSKEYIAVCRSGGRSAQAQQFLRQAGFTQVLNLQGGMMRWHGPLAHGR